MAEMAEMVEGEKGAVAREVLGDKVVEMGMEAEVTGVIVHSHTAIGDGSVASWLDTAIGDGSVTSWLDTANGNGSVASWLDTTIEE
ncbi:hypothetical protein CYMTET_11351 [Cymbomonas tetramitiformis]|uniref:Uncharacterized protein n=1 Tax=Cymbomonas tetramitiformis TaxID=36881 RepID=A0AAE0LDJ8_9CHLO|nr:hypothetical protein CYMTET_11351 [Cymbomonas tetramitiformis]